MYDSEIQRSATRFARETPQHEMTILLDEGLHRHLRFAKPGSSACWFDLISVPGALIFRGDGETYTFARVDDMFDFFRSERGDVNPQYWAEKITDGRDRARVYSEELFRRRVLEEFNERVIDGTIPLEYAGHALGELCRDVLAEDVIADEATARDALEAFEFTIAVGQTARFADVWEWDFHTWDWWYLWACHAIVNGIKRYDTAKACPECKGENGKHNTTVIASTDGGTVRRCSRDPKALAVVDPAVQAAGRASTIGRPFEPAPAAPTASA
jgi:hypothetical protein